MDFFMNADYAVFWSAFGAIATGLASGLGALALLYSMIVYKESLKLSHYSELDNMYSNLLQIALDKTYLLKEKKFRSPEQEEEYNIYAFLVWNFLETISDRCEGNAQLQETWTPILTTEAQRHLEWFKRPENEGKFKKSFHQTIDNLVSAAKSSSTTHKLAS